MPKLTSIIKYGGLGIVVILMVGLFTANIKNRSIGDTSSNKGNNLMGNLDNLGQSSSTDLHIDVLTEGVGNETKVGNQISVHYVGMLEDGKIFDKNTEGAPFTFLLGRGEVIQGWDLGLVGMRVGEKRKLTIPSELAYGEMGFPNLIPPKATLLFEVELLEIK